MTPSPATLTRIEKAAVDNGFDRELPQWAEWRGYGSTQVPLRVWLSAHAEGLRAALSQPGVVRALTDEGLGTPSPVASPPGAVAVLITIDIPALHHLLRRAFQLSRNLPDELLHTFEKKTAALPRSTEAERLVIERVGQGLFRAGLLEFWEGRCAMTGLHVPALLRASHIKSWADCDTDAERLDVYNGLLLAPHLDALFDGGYITVEDDGAVRVSGELLEKDREILGVAGELRVAGIRQGHRRYLAWHRRQEWRGG